MPQIDFQTSQVDRPWQPGRERLLCQIGGKLVDRLDALAIYIVQTASEDKKLCPESRA
jgi:hypothetical protein